jgi:alpha-L-rhamnosidase
MIGFALAVAVVGHAAPRAPLRPGVVALTIEHLVNPGGVDAAQPRFSWQMRDPRRGARQSGYRILVASDRTHLTAARADVWNSGATAGGATVDVPYTGPALQPDHRYYWTVCLRDREGRALPCAAPAWFDTGMREQPWRGQWIAATTLGLDTVARDPADGNGGNPASRPPLMRKMFTLAARPVRAHVFVAVLGAYRLHVNGVEVNAETFTPDWTDYATRITYQSYDVTPMLHAGANAIGALLGAGWFASRMGYNSTRYAYGPPPVRMQLELHLTYADGHQQVIVSDTTWRTAPSAMLISEIYDGEMYDGRLEQPGWDRAAFDDHAWHHVIAMARTRAMLQTQSIPLIRASDSLRPVARWSPRPGVYVFDLGQNIAGWARLQAQGPAGTHVQMRFAEILDADSNISQINLRTAKATDVYVLRGGGPERFEPHFTYHGFRYIEVTGFPGVPTRDDITGIVVHTDLPKTGSIVTSSPALNRLWQNILWTQRANLYSVPTDCPQRDERMGWMGDAQVFWRTASYNMDMAAFGEKWLTDVRDGQAASGCYPNYAPNFLGGGCGAPGWADAGVIIPWTTWRQYDDTTIVSRNWSAMSRYLQFIADSNPNHLWLHRKQTQYGDWLPAGGTTSWGETNTDLISTGLWAYDASLMAQMARALGKSSDAARYDTLFAAIRAAFDSAYISADGKVGAPFTNADSIHTVYTQTAAVLALHFGLVPDALRGQVMQHLADDIAAHGSHLTTGFLGSAYILPVLTEGGRDDLAYQLLFTRTFPSWLYEVDHGATTTWERWNGDHGNPEMNSYSHYAFGAVGEWLYRDLAGIDQAPDGVGFDHVVIHPHWGAPLDSVRAVYRSVRGAIRSDWRKVARQVIVTVTLPANTTGVVELPVPASAHVTVDGARERPSADGVRRYAIDGGTWRFVVTP